MKHFLRLCKYLAFFAFSKYPNCSSYDRNLWTAKRTMLNLWTTKRTMLKNKPHVVMFNESILLSLWTFLLKIVYFRDFISIKSSRCDLEYYWMMLHWNSFPLLGFVLQQLNPVFNNFRIRFTTCTEIVNIFRNAIINVYPYLWDHVICLFVV